jgi:hypothetical protein
VWRAVVWIADDAAAEFKRALREYKGVVNERNSPRIAAGNLYPRRVLIGSEEKKWDAFTKERYIKVGINELVCGIDCSFN